MKQYINYGLIFIGRELKVSISSTLYFFGMPFWFLIKSGNVYISVDSQAKQHKLDTFASCQTVNDWLIQQHQIEENCYERSQMIAFEGTY